LRLSNAVLASAFIARSVTVAQNVDRSHAPGVDFSRYHTYKWVVIEGRQHPDPNKDAQIKQVIDHELAAKRLAMTDAMADLNVDYQVALSTTEKWKSYEDWAPFLGRVPMREVINTGTLVVDMYDIAAKKLVWTGRVTKTIDTSDAPADPEQKRKTVQKAVHALLKDYPPK
jgi:hypothetical protein